MSLHAATITHADKAAAPRGGESVIPSKAKAKRGAAQLGASLLKEAHSTSLSSVAKSSSADNKNPAMETDDKELATRRLRRCHNDCRSRRRGR